MDFRIFLAFFCVIVTSQAMRVKRDFEGKMIDDVRTLLGPGKQVDLVIAIDRSRGMGIRVH